MPSIQGEPNCCNIRNATVYVFRLPEHREYGGSPEELNSPRDVNANSNNAAGLKKDEVEEGDLNQRKENYLVMRLSPVSMLSTTELVAMCLGIAALQGEL